MMKTPKCLPIAIALLSVSFAGSADALAQSSTSDATTSGASAAGSSAADQKFAQKAMEGGMAEVQLGQLAAQQASSQDVKRFGQQMVDDHTRLNNQMTQLAPSLGVTPPTSLSPKDQALQTKLQGLSGDQFDKAYLAAMVKDHKKDLAEFKKEAATTQNPQLKQAVEQGQTVIQGHLKMVEGLAKTHHAGQTAGL